MKEYTKWFIYNSLIFAALQFLTTLSVQALFMGGKVEVVMNLSASAISALVVFLVQCQTYTQKELKEHEVDAKTVSTDNKPTVPADEKDKIKPPMLCLFPVM